jgi:heme exporter protein C
VIQRRWLDVAAVGTLATAFVTALVVPSEQTQGNLARVIFVHVPAAWLAYLAFGVTLLGSIAYLATKKIRWDRLAAASAEVGVYFTGLAIALGMIWGKPTWGVWWTWDARLVLTAVMFFVYLGYLALRRGIQDPVVRARRSAWLGILGVVQIPLVHFSVLWWRTLHQPPTILRPGEMQMDPPFFGALMMALVAYTVVYAALVRRNMDYAEVEAQLHDVMASEEIEVAGAAITAPRYGEVN